MTERAVVDRFEGDQAVIQLVASRSQLVVPRCDLPEQAVAGVWLQVEVKDGQLVSASVDPDETREARRRIREKLQRLRLGQHLPKT
jgi:hypothetical protein